MGQKVFSEIATSFKAQVFQSNASSFQARVYQSSASLLRARVYQTAASSFRARVYQSAASLLRARVYQTAASSFRARVYQSAASALQARVYQTAASSFRARVYQSAASLFRARVFQSTYSSLRVQVFQSIASALNITTQPVTRDTTSSATVTTTAFTFGPIQTVLNLANFGLSVKNVASTASAVVVATVYVSPDGTAFQKDPGAAIVSLTRSAFYTFTTNGFIKYVRAAYHRSPTTSAVGVRVFLQGQG